MRNKSCVLFFAACAACVFLGLNVGGQTPPPLRVMPLGDSITYGASTPGGYRLPLYVALTNQGFNIDMVGTATDNSASGLGSEINHEGHSGWRISTTGSNGLYENILSWLAQIDDPDVVLIHVGTNDTNDPDFEHAIDELDALILRIAETRPYAHIVATTLMKRGTDDTEPKYIAITNYFNPYVLGRVQAHQAAGRRVHFLDMHAYLERTDMYDNLHPSADGYAKMAAAWFPVVTNIVGLYGDRLPPGFSSARAASPTSLTAIFSKPLDLAASPAVTNPASYTIAPAGTVTAVSTLSGDLRQVTLTVSGVPQNAQCSLTFNGTLTDLVPAAEGGPFSATRTETRAFLTPPISAYAADNVPTDLLEGWDPLYTLNIPTGARYGRDPVGYSLDASAAYAHAPLSRVAYYMALQRTGEPLLYVWAAVDAFTQDAAKLGVPTTLSGAFFQQTVSNLTVHSTSPAVTPGQFPVGNIEFWPCNYTAGNGAAVPEASGSIFDFGDTPSNGEYGSMQLHNTAEGETIFALNHWGSASTAYYTTCLGIGNNPNPSTTSSGGQLDWTFTDNAGQYATRVLQVFIKRAAAPVPRDPPVPVSAYTGYDGVHIAVTFSSALRTESVTASAFTLDNGVSVTDATLGKDLMTVTLTTTPQPSGAALTLTAAGLRDIQGGIPTAPASVAVDLLPAEITADAGTFAAGYRVVYTLDIPVYSDFGQGIPDPYIFNAAASSTPFSRVAYYLALGQRPFASPARQYAWASMDAFTPFLSKIGIPNTATKAIFAQYVTNLTVRSNKSGVINGEFDTGNIEFWPSNYGTGNDRGIPGASGSTYDFGDGGFSGSAGHGSFQVHNYLKAQTVFGINRWGSNTSTPVGIGIGTPVSSETLNSSDKDWTFADNTAAHASRRLYVLARPEVPVPAETLTPPAEVIAHVLEQVPDVADYRHLYTVDIPRQPKFANATVRPTYYSVDNATRFANTPHTRVAYFLELVKNNVTSFCWTAFDPICAGVNRLGVPANDDFFQQTVSNLDVFSNVDGVVNTNGCDTGNIEFWDWDYQQTNAAAIPGASDSTFDFGDRRSGSRGGGYGSMQVHNYGAGQTCWALSRFGSCGGNDSVCVGIGNNPSGSPDWTHSNSGANWDSRRLLVFIKPEPQTPAIPAEVLANVPDAAAFKHLYTIDIPVRARFDVDASNTLYYSVDNAATLNGAFGRVGYYMELVKGDVTNFCWTAFDAFTQDPTHLGVPRKGNFYQRFVYNLDVRSNVAGVINTNGCDTGNIEFWDKNYSGADNLGIPGSSNSAFDFADSRNNDGSYGSMQVHNWGAKQTLWAFNRFNSSTENVCIGIGNNPSGHPDWTFALNGHQYDSRRLLVFIQPAGGPDTVAPVAIQPSRAIGQTSLDRVLVVFNTPVADSAADPANFSADKDLAILAAQMHPVYSNTCVVLTTSPQTADTVYTLTINNIRDRRPISANVMFLDRKVSFTAQTEASARPDFLTGIPEAADYRLVQKLALNRQAYWAKGAPFSLDDTWPSLPSFDRVAYALDLLGTNGVRQWVWVSMDPFTTDSLRIGLPTGDRFARFQQYVTNMTVAAASTVTTVTPGSFDDGNIEFWPNNYGGANEAGIPGASDSTYDFGDRIDPNVPVGHGSFQIHNYRLKQTLFAVNSWGNDNRAIELGIGNRPTGAPDWTGSGAYNEYSSRTLYVFVRPSAAAPMEPVPDPGWGTLPTLLLSPTDQRVDVKASAFFSVLANGAVRYQWCKDGVFIPGATSSMLEIPDVRGVHTGSYTVLVYGSGSRYVVSLPALLEINADGTVLILQ
jgi:lysophospholipase L1-like esterase